MKKILKQFFQFLYGIYFTIKIIFIFRLEIYHRKNLDNFLAKNLNSMQLQKKILSLGCISIKMAQWLAQRIDVLGPNTINTLLYFQKSVPAHSFFYTKFVIENSLGHSYRKTFSFIEPNVLGSGSISQVHRCRLNDYTDNMVVKVIHPVIKKDLNSSVNLFKGLSDLLVFIFPKIRIFNPGSFISTIPIQTDYNNEVSNQLELSNILKPLKFVIVPKIYKYSKDFIVFEECLGYSRTELEKYYPEYVIDMGEKSMFVYTWMVYNGIVHVDMHDGNVFYVVDSNDDSNNKIILLDYGLIMHLDNKYENSFIVRLYEGMGKYDNNIIHKTILDSIDKKIQADYNLVSKQLKKIDFFSVNIAQNSVIECLSTWLSQINEIGLILKTPELFSFLGCLLITRLYTDSDGNKYDLLPSMLLRMRQHSDENVQKCATRLYDNLSSYYIRSTSE
tara:strand:+ start:581 stop:1918 length:1338 start_codon:yes stop_codon:yes gene_type:complete